MLYVHYSELNKKSVELRAPVGFYRYLCYPIVQNIGQMSDNIWSQNLIAGGAVEVINGYVNGYVNGSNNPRKLGYNPYDYAYIHIINIIYIYIHLQLELLPQYVLDPQPVTSILVACMRVEYVCWCSQFYRWYLDLVDCLRQPPCFSRRCPTNVGPRAAHSCRDSEDSVQWLPIKIGYPHPKIDHYNPKTTKLDAHLARPPCFHGKQLYIFCWFSLEPIHWYCL